jgi:hypothetical protein
MHWFARVQEEQRVISAASLCQVESVNEESLECPCGSYGGTLLDGLWHLTVCLYEQHCDSRDMKKDTLDCGDRGLSLVA